DADHVGPQGAGGTSGPPASRRTLAQPPIRPMGRPAARRAGGNDRRDQRVPQLGPPRADTRPAHPSPAGGRRRLHLLHADARGVGRRLAMVGCGARPTRLTRGYAIVTEMGQPNVKAYVAKGYKV